MHKATAKLQMKMGFAEGTWAGLRGAGRGRGQEKLQGV